MKMLKVENTYNAPATTEMTRATRCPRAPRVCMDMDHIDHRVRKDSQKPLGDDREAKPEATPADATRATANPVATQANVSLTQIRGHL